MNVPIIVAANTKGGSGKSTSTLILGTSLARRGATVRIIDADPQQTILHWSQGENRYRGIVVAPTQDEDLTDLIDRLSEQYQFVLIDVQGSANEEMAAAMSRADLVIIPMRGKTADAEVAPKAIALLRKQEKLFKRRIAHGVLFVATNPQIKTREEKEIRKNVEEAQIPCFQTDLNERTAFSHVFRFKLGLDELNENDTNRLDAALLNADMFADEIVHLLRQTREVKQEVIQ